MIIFCDYFCAAISGIFIEQGNYMEVLSEMGSPERTVFFMFDKAVLFMAILTIMAALFGLVLYRYTVLRYILICIGMIAGVKIALVALKKMKNNC